MVITTAIATTKQVIDSGQLAHKAWNWWKKWRHGSINFTSPSNREVVRSQFIDVSGLHQNLKGNFWLFTAQGNDYWPQCRVNPEPDGRWNAKISVGLQAKPMTCPVLLVWLSDSMHSIINDIKERSHRAEDWSALNMVPPKGHFLVVQGIVLHVEQTPISKT